MRIIHETIERFNRHLGADSSLSLNEQESLLRKSGLLFLGAATVSYLSGVGLEIVYDLINISSNHTSDIVNQIANGCTAEAVGFAALASVSVLQFDTKQHQQRFFTISST